MAGFMGEFQPCGDFKPRKNTRGPMKCSACGALVCFCENCQMYHHMGGWKTCSEWDKVGGVSDGMRGK